MIKIAPSILSADFANLERDIRRIESADYVHVDVMDGLFVPNITIGIPVVKSIRPTTALPLDVHLMIDRPVRYVEAFCQAGADIVTVHVEADTEENTGKALELIQAQGKRPGVVIKPRTPAEAALFTAASRPLCRSHRRSAMVLLVPGRRIISGWWRSETLSTYRRDRFS